MVKKTRRMYYQYYLLKVVMDNNKGNLPSPKSCKQLWILFQNVDAIRML